MRRIIVLSFIWIVSALIGCEGETDPCGGSCEAGEVCTVDGQCVRLVAEPARTRDGRI